MDPATNVGVEVATEATTWSLAKIIKHIGYLYKYKQNLESLKVAAKQLDAKRKDASRFAQDTNRKQQDVSNTIADWRPEADELYQNAQNIISTNIISCLHPWSRYSTSKNALEMAKEINEKVQAAAQYFGTRFDRQPHKLGDTFDLKAYKEFESRASVVDAIWEELKNKDVSIFSICGMGGTGKTTLAKKLIQRAQSESLFDKAAIVTVSQDPNLTKIRSSIMSSLRLEFKIEEMETPTKLTDCLMNNDDGSVLLILDDVWGDLNFEEIGLPKAKLKIVLTSRSIAACERMGSKPNFVIDVLTDEEAQHMFREIAIDSIEKLTLHDMARSIADECGGLPLVIATLATALKHEDKATWNDSLVKLKRSNLLDIPEMEKVYLRIHLSYDLLNDQEVKACFRLCSLFHEDANIPVDFLMLFGKGLELFKNVESMSETRDRVASIIRKLKKSFLLLDGDKDDTVKMHDILRDFAVSISSENERPYIVRCEKVMKEWPKSTQYEKCSAISLMCDKINEHPRDLKCPNLELLQLVFAEDRVELPIGIFEESNELKVLFLAGSSSLLQSLPMPRKLRTLIISENSWSKNTEVLIGDFLGHEDIKNLEILALTLSGVCDNFPEGIRNLCNLRYLHFGAMKFGYIPPGVFSKLVNLEELILPLQFIRWGCKEEGGERLNASFDEIESLPLTSLDISLYDSTTLPQKLLKNLTRFRISVGTTVRYNHSSAMVYVFKVDTCDIPPLSWMSCLMSKCEILKLEEVKNLKNIMCMQSGENWFLQLKAMWIEGCHEMEYLIDFTISAPCFSNLGRLLIRFCRNLKRLFPLSVARQLRQLQSIVIRYCDELEEIFYKDQVDGENQEVVGSSVQLITTLTIETTTTPTMSNSNIVDDKSPVICCPTSFVPCLRGKQKNPKKVPIQQTREETTAKADEKEVDNTTMDSIVFPQLKSLQLACLAKLRTFYDGNHAIEFPSLEEFYIIYCNTMEVLSSGSIKSQCLKEILINYTHYPAEGDDLNALVTKVLAIENEITRSRGW